MAKVFLIPGSEQFYVEKRLKYGFLIGGFFAVLAFGFAELNGFNRSTFLVFIYLYVLLGAVSRLRLEDFSEYASGLENLIWIKEEEMKLKRVFTGEEYEIDGTVKKVQ